MREREERRERRRKRRREMKWEREGERERETGAGGGERESEEDRRGREMLRETHAGYWFLHSMTNLVAVKPGEPLFHTITTTANQRCFL